MSNKNKINTGEQTDVMTEKIINFEPLETETRDDDFDSWNAMQFMGKSDKEEAEQGSARVELDSNATILTKRRVGRVAILGNARLTA